MANELNLSESSGVGPYDLSTLDLLPYTKMPFSAQCGVVKNGVTLTEGTDFSINTTANTITFTVALVLADTVILTRDTPADPVVTFLDGARLPASDLNVNQQQLLNLIEEITIEGGGGAVDSVNGQTGDVTITASGLGAVTDAPNDGQLYGRKEEDWEVINITGTGAVDSVNGQTGAVVLDNTDVGAAATSHTHAIGDVTNLQTTLDGKQATLTGTSDVPGLDTALAAKQDDLTGTSDVPGLDTALAGKVNTSDSVDVLNDVDTTTAAPTLGQALTWDGSNWTPGNTSAAAIAASFASITVGSPNITPVTTSVTIMDTSEWDGYNVDAESSDALFTSNVDAAGVWTPPAGTYVVEGQACLTDGTNGDARMRLRYNSDGGTPTPVYGNAGRFQTKSVDGDQWCQASWIIEADGTTSYSLVLDSSTGSCTYVGVAFNVRSLAGSAGLAVGDNVSDLTNDAGYITSAPVSSVNTATGAVVLTGDDIATAADDATSLHTSVDNAATIALSANATANSALTAANNALYSDNENGVGNNSVINVIKLTQSEYDALTPVATTLYIIDGA